MILQGLVLMARYLYTIGGPARARNYLAGHAARYRSNELCSCPATGHLLASRCLRRCDRYRVPASVAWAGDVPWQTAGRRPPAWFASREQAAARYLRISGLAGLLPAADPAVDEGLREEHGRWRLAVDPGAFAVGAPDMTHLLARSQAPAMLARGEHDAMNTDEQLVRLGVPVVTLPGLGHNAHVESPHLTIRVLDPYR
jgi:pimeloyl-ACP methyl ester carboxylesterase